MGSQPQKQKRLSSNSTSTQKLLNVPGAQPNAEQQKTNPQSDLSEANSADKSDKSSQKSAERRENQPGSGLFDLLLRAACKVSPFRTFLQSHRQELYTEDEESSTDTSSNELDKLMLQVAINASNSDEWSDFSLVGCFVKIIKNLDSLRGKEREAGSVFSAGLNVVTVCGKCAVCERLPLTLCALRIADLYYFETNAGKEEIEHFNPHRSPSEENAVSLEDKQKYYSALNGRNSSETLQQLLLNAYCTSPSEKIWCQKCLQNTEHWKLTELQSLSPGLVISLPKGWGATYVPEILNLEENPIVRANYRLRAAVVKEADFTAKGRWLCVDTLTKLKDEFQENPALLFYELCEVSTTKPKKIKRLSINIQRHPRDVLIRVVRKRRKSQFMKKSSTQDAIETAKEGTADVVNLKASKCSIETGQKEEWICSDTSAGLEAALRGLFTIKTFTTCFEEGLFEPTYLHMSRFLPLLNSVYKEYKGRNIQKQTLEQLMGLLWRKENTPYQYILKVLTECDDSVQIASRFDFSQMHKLTVEKLKENRCGKCEILHDCFSVLTRHRDKYLCDTWTYSRVLNIPIDCQIREVDNALESPATADNSENIIDLETCIVHLFRSKLEQFPKKGPINISPFYYIGSALIIRLFTQNEDRLCGNIICVHRVLQAEKLGIVTSSEFRLRAIVHYTKAKGNRFFKFERVENSGSSCHQLIIENMEYLLFFERDVIKFEIKTPEFEENEKMVKFSYGLRNLGNTCFMNAALNGLYSLDVFRAYFTKSESTQLDPLLRALSTFCSKHTKEEVPSEVLLQFKCAISKFDDGQQHCANNYTFKLLELLDQLQVSKSLISPRGPFENKSQQYRKGKCEPLHDMFSALTENLFICRRCSHARRNFSYFRTVDVPIPYRGETVDEWTLFCKDNFYPAISTGYIGTDESKNEYIDNFFQVEQKLSNFGVRGKQRNIDLYLCFEYMLRASLMSSNSLMLCDQCGNNTQHYKQSFFRRLSKVLVIHFQRFDDRSGQKLNTFIDFPLELDMSKYCVNDQRKYVLRGVVYHMGSLNYGHYTACISVRGRWYEVNDSQVREERSPPPIENAYMLFYEEKMS